MVSTPPAESRAQAGSGRASLSDFFARTRYRQHSGLATLHLSAGANEDKKKGSEVGTTGLAGVGSLHLSPSRRTPGKTEQLRGSGDETFEAARVVGGLGTRTARARRSSPGRARRTCSPPPQRETFGVLLRLKGGSVELPHSVEGRDKGTRCRENLSFAATSPRMLCAEEQQSPVYLQRRWWWAPCCT